MPSPVQPPSRIDVVRTRLEGFLQAGRRRWRYRTLLRGAGAAGALGAASILVLGAMHLAGILPPSVQPVARWIPLVFVLGVLGATAIRVLRGTPSLRAMALRMDEVEGPDPASTRAGGSHLPLIVLDLPATHPYAAELARQMDRRLEGRRSKALLPPAVSLREGGLGILTAGLAALLVVVGGGPGSVWSDWGVGASPGSGPLALTAGGEDVGSPTSGRRRRIPSGTSACSSSPPRTRGSRQPGCRCPKASRPWPGAASGSREDRRPERSRSVWSVRTRTRSP